MHPLTRGGNPYVGPAGIPRPRRRPRVGRERLHHGGAPRQRGARPRRPHRDLGAPAGARTRHRELDPRPVAGLSAAPNGFVTAQLVLAVAISLVLLVVAANLVVLVYA